MQWTQRMSLMRIQGNIVNTPRYLGSMLVYFLQTRSKEINEINKHTGLAPRFLWNRARAAKARTWITARPNLSRHHWFHFTVKLGWTLLKSVAAFNLVEDIIRDTNFGLFVVSRRKSHQHESIQYMAQISWNYIMYSDIVSTVYVSIKNLAIVCVSQQKKQIKTSMRVPLKCDLWQSWRTG